MTPEASAHEHIATLPTAITFSRPFILAPEVSRRLITGEGRVTPLMVAVGVSDGEGFIARLIDKYFPESGRGSTEFGKALDPIADSAAFVEIAAAALVAPRVSRLGKAAVGIVLASETVKATWAIQKNIKHRATTGKQLVIQPSKTGKYATTGKFAALTAAVATHDLEPGRKRTILGWVAVGSALSGAFLGEKARRGYSNVLKEKQ